MTDKIEERLISHGIRPTALRLMILKELDKANRPLSALDMERLLDTVDRSTITRALAKFTEKGIIHLIDDGSGAAKYESCPSENHHTAADMHVHFHCRKCETTFCLHSTAIPHVELPSGFSIDTASYILSGICPSCNADRRM